MSDLLDFSLDELTPVAVPQLSQGIFCSPFFIALPYLWAKSIVEEFELVAVPKSPPWMAGVANLAGVILPVIDLSAYFSPTQQPNPIHKQHRLLIGGDFGGGDEAVPMALLFEGLPQQVKALRRSVSEQSSMPQELAQLCVGELTNERGQSFFELDPDLLTQALLQAL